MIWHASCTMFLQHHLVRMLINRERIFMKTAMLAAASALLLASASQATVTVYNSQAAFAAALGPLATEDFTDATLVSGLSIVSTASQAAITGGHYHDRTVLGGAQTIYSFAGGANGFGAIFDLSPGGFGQGLQFTLNLTAGGTEVVPVLAATQVGAFFGFTSTNTFSSVLVTSGTNPGVAETHDLDDLQFGSVAGGAVPEPASWMLMVAGFGMVGAGLRRRSTAVAA